MGEEKRIISYKELMAAMDLNCDECAEGVGCEEKVCPVWQKLEVPAVVKTCVMCEDEFVPLYGGQEMCLPCQKDSI